MLARLSLLRPRLLPALALLAFLSAACAQTPAAFPTQVPTAQGPVRGQLAADSQTLSWLGIPYAQPPVGPLRWKAPHPAPARTAPLDAAAYGSPCYQLGTKSSEDCLYLNICRPNSPAKRLPVLVYIHGGNNIYGSGEGSWQAAALHLNTVVVTFNYRLGPFGWFLHPALRTGDPSDDSGN